jgi:hypothetical protein
MKLLLAVLEVCVQILGCWTLAYHLWLLLALPAGQVWVPFLLLWLPVLLLAIRHWRRTLHLHRVDHVSLLGVALLSLLLGGLFLVNQSWNIDGFAYVHRALVQLDHLDQPFFRTTTELNVDLPILLNTVTPSHEQFVVMSAAVLGIDPLWAYQNLGGALGVMLLPVAYTLLYRQMRLPRTFAVAATGTAILFLLLDGNHLGTFGFWSLTQVWLGKFLLLGVGVPIGLVLARQFLLRPTVYSGVMIALTGVCATGMTNTGVIVWPVALAACGLAYLASHTWRWLRIRRVLLLGIGGLYCVLMALTIRSGLLTELGIGIPTWRLQNDAIALQLQLHPLLQNGNWRTNSGFPWLQTLYLSISGTPLLLMRNLVLLILVPLVLLRRPVGGFWVAYSGALMFLFATPISGPLFNEMLSYLVYWRLALLFPVPLCAGLLVLAFRWRALPRRRAIEALVISVLALLLMLLPFWYTALHDLDQDKQRTLAFKAPSAPRFPPDHGAFAQEVAPQLSGRNLLAPDWVAVAVGLLNPSVHLEAHATYSLNRFLSAGLRDEGLRRLEAQARVRECLPPDVRATYNEALLQSLVNGVDTLIVQDCGPEDEADLAAVLQRAPGQWRETHRAHGFRMLLRTDVGTQSDP